MKIKETLESVNQLKPNVVSDKDKFKWINTVEGTVYNNIFAKAADTDFTFTPYVYGEDENSELFVPDPYSEIYYYYLCAMIDMVNGEIASYNNNMSMYNSMYDDFAVYYRRNHYPKRGY